MPAARVHAPNLPPLGRSVRARAGAGHRTLLAPRLAAGGRGLPGGHRRSQAALVILEVALALVLLVGAGLMVRTLTRLWSVDPGFDPERVLTFGVSLPPAMAKETPEAIRTALHAVETTVSAVPGVRAVSLFGGAFP